MNDAGFTLVDTVVGMGVVTDERIGEAIRRLGWTSLRPMQERILGLLFGGQDVIAVCPTSAGKSGLYQIPALARSGVVVVLSPLVALMIDQVRRLRDLGIEAWALHSHVSSADKKRIAESLASGACKILYVSPERMQSLSPSDFEGTHVQLFAVDEAHCISEWGHDFRPAYRKIGRQLRRYGPVQILAVTATATLQVLDEIEEVLGTSGPKSGTRPVRVVNSPDRPNLTYGIAGHKVSVVRLVGRCELPCLVYGSTRRSVEEAALQLERSGFRSAAYHAGLDKAERARVQDAFLEGRIDVVCATCAFGMGIDHPSIRAVLHLEMPTSIESYLQESGRAGRDGRPALAVCRATMETLEVARSLTIHSWPEPGRIRFFWNHVQPLFEAGAGKWPGEDAFQLTTPELLSLLPPGFTEMEVDACLRLLHDEGALARIPYQERSVEVVLLEGTKKPRGPRQKEVMDTLWLHADSRGIVEGSVRFFREVVGMDRAFADRLCAGGFLRMTWAPKVQIVQRKMEPGSLEIDEERIVRIRRRALARIDEAEGYLLTPGCRRAYLLRYFGDDSGGTAIGRCCDRCEAR